MLVAPCSDAYNNIKVADDFFGLTKPIVGIDFWGVEHLENTPCTKPSLDFIVSFYEYGPFPGNLVYEDIITVQKVGTRRTLFNKLNNDYVSKYSGTLSTPVTLTEGWFSVQAVDSGGCVFLWVDAGLISSDYGYLYWDDELGWLDSGFDYNLAFCLLEDPPVPTPDPTPTPTEPPEPTTNPEPTPEYPLGVRLEMPETAHPGDEFFIIGYLDNPGEPLSEVPTFFILEVYGKFWFWPSWAYFDHPEYTEIDWKNIDVPTGTTNITVIPSFEWPDTGSDIVTGLGFYGAMLNPEVTDILGEIAYQEWGYGP